MGSRFNKYQRLIIFTIAIIIGILSITEIIDTVIPLFICIILTFIMGNIVVPLVDGRNARKQYDESNGNKSLTLLTITRCTSDKINKHITHLEDIGSIKFYPRIIVRMFIILNIFPILIPISLLLNYIKRGGLETDLVIVSSIALIALILLDFIFVFIIRKQHILISNDRIKSKMKQSFDIRKKVLYEEIIYSNIVELNVKRNEYINYKNKGVIFEFVLFDGTKRIVLCNLFSDKQRDEIVQLLKERIE